MTGIATAIAVTGIGGALLASSAAKKSTRVATEATEAASTRAIDEQRRQFDKLQSVLAPFVAPGERAIAGQEALLGLSGDEAQAEAIAGIEGSPLFGALVQQGEEAILQNASATGELRGGNTARSLAQFRPQILSQLIESQFNKLGGLTGIGQASAAGVGAGAIRTGENVSNIFTRAGDVEANAAIARGAIDASLFGDISGSIGTLLGNQDFTSKVF